MSKGWSAATEGDVEGAAARGQAAGESAKSSYDAQLQTMADIDSAMLEAVIDSFPDNGIAGPREMVFDAVNRYGPQAMAWAQRHGTTVANWVALHGNKAAAVMSRYGSQLLNAIRGLNVVKEPLSGLGTNAARLAYRGPANSILRGGNVERGANAGSMRAYVTDSVGKIIREVTLDRVKVRVTNTNAAGQAFDGFRKVGSPTSADHAILDRLK